MSTVIEIERAIERLPAAEVGALALWLNDYHASLQSAARIGEASPKPFLKLAGTLEGPADLSQRKGFSAK